MTSAAELIADSFNDYFGNFNVRITPDDVAVGVHGTVVEQLSDGHPPPSWYVQYRVDADNDGQPFLEFYATSRMTNDRHARISADGRGEHLEAVSEMYAYDPEAPAEVQAAAREEFDKRNREITEILRARGFRP
jgi:hypothetical protein